MEMMMELLIALAFGTYARALGERTARQMRSSGHGASEERPLPILWDRIGELRPDGIDCAVQLKPERETETVRCRMIKGTGGAAPIAYPAWITPGR
jgi:hypothetical protein